LLLGAGALALVGLAAGGLLLFVGRDPITPSNCARLQKGMTQAQVEAILGREPDWLIPDDEFYGGLAWRGPDGRIEVYFNEDEVAIAARYFPERRTLVDRLRRLLPW
jgi:hypothetical protein